MVTKLDLLRWDENTEVWKYSSPTQEQSELLHSKELKVYNVVKTEKKRFWSAIVTWSQDEEDSKCIIIIF
jgi:hypothetical protein